MEDSESILPLPPTVHMSGGGASEASGISISRRSSNGSLRGNREEELWVARQQMHAWQQTAHRALAKLDKVQESRDMLLSEVMQLKQDLEESQSKTRDLEDQLNEALKELGRQCLLRAGGDANSDCQSDTALMSALSASHLSEFDSLQRVISCDSPERLSASSRDDPPPDEVDSSRAMSTKSSSVEHSPAPKDEADDLAARLVEKTMELAHLKEQQETEARGRRMLEAANLKLAEKLANMTSAMMEMQAALDQRR